MATELLPQYFAERFIQENQKSLVIGQSVLLVKTGKEAKAGIYMGHSDGDEFRIGFLHLNANGAVGAGAFKVPYDAILEVDILTPLDVVRIFNTIIQVNKDQEKIQKFFRV